VTVCRHVRLFLQIGHFCTSKVMFCAYTDFVCRFVEIFHELFLEKTKTHDVPSC